jgi:hypothetical protein
MRMIMGFPLMIIMVMIVRSMVCSMFVIMMVFLPFMGVRVAVLMVMFVAV